LRTRQRATAHLQVHVAVDVHERVNLNVDVNGYASSTDQNLVGEA
jgi:hypothetical protein